MSTVEEHSSEQIELRTSKPRAVLKADFFFLSFVFLSFRYIGLKEPPARECTRVGAAAACGCFRLPRQLAGGC